MRPEHTAVLKQAGECWIAWIVEVPGVNRREPARLELLHSRREILREALEFDRSDALQAAGSNLQEERISP